MSRDFLLRGRFIRAERAINEQKPKLFRAISIVHLRNIPGGIGR